MLNIVGIYHNTILTGAAASRSNYQPSMHTRYTHHYTQHNRRYKRIAYLLAVLQKSELLMEILSRRYGGEKGQKTSVLTIESAKSVLRLILFYVTKMRMVPSSVVPGRDFEPSMFEDEDENLNETPTGADTVDVDRYWTMPRTGRRLPLPKQHQLPSREDEVAEFLIKRVLHPDDVAPGPRLMHKLTRDGQANEVMYLLRPLIYTLLTYIVMRRNSNNRTKNKGGREQLLQWMPWIIGILMDWTYQNSVLTSLSEEFGGMRNARSKLTGLEKEELQKRKDDLWWWALRGKFYDSITK